MIEEETMMNRIVTALLASLFLLPAGCENSGPDTGDETGTTGESVDTSSESGAVVEDSSSSSSEDSTGDEGSGSTSGSESSTGEPFMGEPDPQPEDDMFASCEEQTALACRLSIDCLIYDEWQTGFCTETCHSVTGASVPFECSSAVLRAPMLTLGADESTVQAENIFTGGSAYFSNLAANYWNVVQLWFEAKFRQPW